MSKRFTDRILEHISQPGYRPLQAARLARALGIADAEWGDFHEAVDALRRLGRVVYGTNNALMLPPPPAEITGVYRGNPRGFGFVVPDETTAHGDLFIPPGDSLDAITGDRVRCRVLSRGKRDGKPDFGGMVVKILERGNSRFVGRLNHEAGRFFVQPDGNTLHVPIFVDDVTAKGAKPGDQVVVEILRYPTEGRPAKGVIIERLGKWGQRDVDLLSIIRQHQLPSEFPEEALAEARRAAKEFDPENLPANREDLSGQVIITIDPDDARDFDDAISLERLEGRESPAKAHRKGGKGRGDDAAWELGVHIADVSHFVRVGGALDDEAVQRGTSVYFPRHVVPMLPEVLSNGVCSLQEGQPRFCKSAFIRYSADGRVVGSRFANTVIRSTKRLTYREASGILEGKVGGFARPVVDLVRKMDTLARTIRQRRLEEGMIVLDLPEVELILDDEGRVTDAEPADTSFSHTIIEMFMVEANEAVARLFRKHGVPFLRRIHPAPDGDAMQDLARFLRAAGHTLPKRISVADIQALLERVRATPQSHALSLSVLKTMETAEYSPKDIGHYALASEAYAHFTSPIRRYPDLMIHRLFQAYLDGRLKHVAGSPEAPSEEQIEEWGRRMSYLSRRAETAERELKTVKVLELLSQQVGQTFKGVVTGVTNFGLFVQHPRFLIDGLLRLEELGNDWWEVDLKSGQVLGERTRQVFTIGTLIEVKILEADVPARQLNLALVQAATRTKGGKAPYGRRERGRPRFQKGFGQRAGRAPRTGPARRGRGRQR